MKHMRRWRDTENDLAPRLVDQPLHAVDARHTHPGTHASTIPRGGALIDGLTLHPLDVIIGTGNEPHGLISFPEGATLLMVAMRAA